MGNLQPREFTLKSGEKIIVRSALLEDTGSLLEMVSEHLQEGEFTLTEPDEFKVTEAQERAWIQQRYDEPGMIVLLAFVQSKLIGNLDFACGWRRKRAHSGEFGIAVRKEWRERGVGRALLQALLDWARDDTQVEKVCLQVFATNSRAMHLYQKLGFVEEGRLSKEIKVAPGHYIDLILMSRFVK